MSFHTLTQLQSTKARVVSGQKSRYLKNGFQMKEWNMLDGCIRLVRELVINY